jgi:hypothetical protein
VRARTTGILHDARARGAARFPDDLEGISMEKSHEDTQFSATGVILNRLRCEEICHARLKGFSANDR